MWWCRSMLAAPACTLEPMDTLPFQHTRDVTTWSPYKFFCPYLKFKHGHFKGQIIKKLYLKYDAQRDQHSDQYFHWFILELDSMSQLICVGSQKSYVYKAFGKILTLVVIQFFDRFSYLIFFHFYYVIFLIQYLMKLRLKSKAEIDYSIEHLSLK